MEKIEEENQLRIYIRRNYIFLHIVCTFIFYIFYGEVIVFIIIQYIVGLLRS